MNKFKRVLSDDWLPLEFQSGNDVPVTSLMVNLKTLKSIVEQAEQAVLARLAEQQEPAAWLHEETGDVISSELKDYAPEMLKGYGTPLYKCPVPSCQGFLDSSNHIANMRKKVKENHIPDASKMVVPEGWQLVPVEITIDMCEASGLEGEFKLSPYEQAQNLWSNMLAAAPKYMGDK